MEAIRWDGKALELIDQRVLPTEERWLRLEHVDDVAGAIRDMVVRGAPAIGITAAYGLVLAERNGVARADASERLLAARPTAVNLRWALERMADIADLEAEAKAIHAEDIELNRAIGRHGAPLLEGKVITICNTGSLATGGHGTALGMVRSALEAGKRLHLYALETRPYLQGARLTTFECIKDNIPCTLITDSMAGALLQKGDIQAVVVGCDRVAANGDTANKIGTYALSVLAKHHGVPVYVGMPTSTLDRRCPTGADIVIEQRNPDEVTHLKGVQIAPDGTPVWNPAFDVTPAELISGWVTEHGVWKTPFPSE
ncbi:MAG: S-methyl-5-thioribose-1-phosphate isomerase [Myxococcota bacterium]